MSRTEISPTKGCLLMVLALEEDVKGSSIHQPRWLFKGVCNLSGQQL